MRDELTSLSVSQLASLIRAREVSPVEVVEAYLSRIELLNPKLNAIVTLAPDVLERARASEQALVRGEAVGALQGVPITIKDTIETAGIRTTSGSQLRADYVPAKDAPAVERLKRAGAIILGKTNAPEMALTYESYNPIFGRTNNPHDAARTPGGSSGGEAAAIAAHLSAAGLGSDLVGSIRIPAHFCGIAGLKPTAAPERIPIAGHFPEIFGRLEHGGTIGPLARRVEDLALLFDVLAGKAKDHSGQASDTNAHDLRDVRLQGKRVAYYTYDGMMRVTEETLGAVELAARALADAGLDVIERRPPGVENATQLWLEYFGGEVSVQMAELFSGREEKAGPSVRALLARPREKKSLEEQLKIAEERYGLRSRLIEWMKEMPFIIAPVGAVPAFEHGARKLSVDSQTASVFQAFGYSQAFNLFNLPAVALPVAQSREGLPIGVQIVGLPYCERHVLAAALAVEERLGGYKPLSALSPQAHNRL